MKLFAAVLCALAIALAALAASPADAAPKKKRAVQATDSNGRARTRVTVQPRTFLDAGTNVVPGERKFTDYFFSPGYGPGSTPGSVVTNFGNGRPGWDTWPSFNSSGPGWSGW